MANAPKISEHRKGRPPSGARKVFRLTDEGAWVPDDGEPGVAFSFESQQGPPIALWGECRCDGSDHRAVRDGCPGRIAMNYTCERFKCANGRNFPRTAWERLIAGPEHRTVY